MWDVGESWGLACGLKDGYDDNGVENLPSSDQSYLISA